MTRKVACIDRINLDKIYQQNRLKFRTNFDKIVSDLNTIQFLEKTLVETNENYKQIIPYILIRNRANQIALYQRKGSEKRLHGLWSAGFGGHIEAFDYQHKENIGELILKSAIRELREEFADNADYNLQFEGVINEEETKVGRTHIGIVFSVIIDSEQFIPSAEIEAIEWVDIHKFPNYKKELWSKLATELLNN
jgi:predicted NUDIX family phosphoesterase